MTYEFKGLPTHLIELMDPLGDLADAVDLRLTDPLTLGMQ
jgi:hypothetical protein